MELHVHLTAHKQKRLPAQVVFICNAVFVLRNLA